MALKTLVSGGEVQIGGDYDGDPKALVYRFPNGESYQRYFDADMAFQRARIARDKALGEPVKWPTGITNFWIENVRLTKDGNEYIPAGTVGSLNVIEVSTGRKVLEAKFYPANSKGFGLVTWPEFERIR